MKTIHIYCFFLIIFIFACSNIDQNDSQTASQDSGQAPQGEIAYTAPQGWVQHPPTSRMRKDQYLLPGTEGKKDAELVVYHFPGMGGMVEANLNRWYGQFQQPDGSETASKAKAKKETVNSIPVTTVFVTGTYLKLKNPMDMAGPKEEKPNYAMLAAIVETADGPWFFKATGPEETIAHWRPSFKKFVASMHVR